MNKTCIIAIGPSRCGKGTLAEIAKSQNYEEIHPIQDLKNFLERILDFPIGGLHTDYFKNTSIQEYTRVFFKFDRLYPKVYEFFTQHFSFLNPESNRYILNWISYEYTNFLVSNRWMLAKDIEIASYHYFKERSVLFPYDYFVRTLEEKKNTPIVFTGVRAIEEAEIITKHIHPSKIIVAYIHRPDYSGISTDQSVTNIYHFFKSLEIDCFHINDDFTLNSFLHDCWVFVDWAKEGDLSSLSEKFN